MTLMKPNMKLVCTVYLTYILSFCNVYVFCCTYINIGKKDIQKKYKLVIYKIGTFIIYTWTFFKCDTYRERKIHENEFYIMHIFNFVNTTDKRMIFRINIFLYCESNDQSIIYGKSKNWFCALFGVEVNLFQ